MLVIVLEEIYYPTSLLLSVQMTDSLLLLVIYNTAALGMMLGADISVTRLFFQALLPATMGNFVGGGFLFAAVYWYVLDFPGTLLPKSVPDTASPALKSVTDTPAESPEGSDSDNNV